MKRLFPTYNHTTHKGSAGRLAVIGGSEDYTGAPYLAAMAALRTGVDTVSIFCPAEAAVPLKAYSPDIIVRPLWSPQRLPELFSALGNIHAVLVGPGLGTSSQTFSLLQQLIPVLVEKRVPVVLDACAIKFVADAHKTSKNDNNSKLFRLNASFILTPNINEFRILCAAVLPDRDDEKNIQKNLMRVSMELDCTIVLKGSFDMVSSHGSSCVELREEGSYRRVGGQGDVFAGMVCAFAAWTEMCGGGQKTECVMAASALMRRCCRTVYERPGGKTFIASDLLATIGTEVERVLAVPSD